MDIKEVMENEEVIEIAEEIAKKNSGRLFKTAAIVGIGALAGVIVYKRFRSAIAARKEDAQKEDTPNEDALKEAAEKEAVEFFDALEAEMAAEKDNKEESTQETTAE